MSRKKLTICEAYYTADNKPDYDLSTCTLRNVKIWGKESKNGYLYADKALKEAVQLSQNVEVYTDHESDKESTTRSVRTLFGVLKEAYIDSTGEVRAKEFKWDASHPYAKSFAWQLENVPNKIGFSVRADAAGYFDPTKKRMVVDEVKSVKSYDIVAGPANTGGIMEQATTMDMTLEQLFEMLAGKIASDTSMDIGAKKKKLNAVLKMMDNGGETEVVDTKMEESAPTDVALAEADKYSNPLIKYLARTVRKFQLNEQERAIKDRTEQRIKLAESKQLPPAFFTTPFKKALETAKDEEVEGLIREQVSLYEQVRVTPTPQAKDGVTKPISHPPEPAAKPEPFDSAKLLTQYFG